MSKIFYFSIFFLLLTSCIRNKNLIYLKGSNFSKEYPTLLKNEKFLYKVQSNDILSVVVQSAQPEISNQFNNNMSGSSSTGGSGNALYNTSPSALFLSGYTVDNAGYITLPTVGKIMVKNLTVADAKELIQSKVSEYLNDASVNVKLVSFKITLLGSVARPGYYYFYNGQVTILEGLGEAGDLTPTGNRKNIKLIRQTSEGAEVVLLDLQDPNLLKSKYYYLLPNDVIYVEPIKAATDRANLSLLAFFFSAITVVVSVLTLIQVK
jgi:polysaccharide export outer membrane protein